MAEERLIDEDKDRKYRLRKNENGEEELVMIDPEEEEPAEDLPVYSVITDEDDGFTEEEREVKNAERQENILRKAEELKAAARKKLLDGDFEGAISSLSQASEITEYDGELYYLQLKAVSRNLTDFSDLETIVEVSEGVKEYSSDDEKQELDGISQPLKVRIKEVSEKCAKLSEDNERGKAERRETFVKDKKRALMVFACTAAPFALFLVLSIVFASMIYNDKNGTFIIPTIVFAALAVAMLIASLFTSNRLIAANRKVKLNEKDSSTQVGRDFLTCSEELDYLNKIHSSFKNDIS
ncbi:MAG: hypothetical protein K2N23_08480 [Clostridia bacterium]|nr:hypothetical protein [Clostridia bacterium]